MINLNSFFVSPHYTLKISFIRNPSTTISREVTLYRDPSGDYHIGVSFNDLSPPPMVCNFNYEPAGNPGVIYAYTLVALSQGWTEIARETTISP